MLQSLRIRNFRMLEDFYIPKLGNVNLIVGKNNCGKSSLLEALRIYASRGNPKVLSDIAVSHDEFSWAAPQREDSIEKQSNLPFRDFFSGRDFPVADEGQAIYIGNNDASQYVEINHKFYREEVEDFKTEAGPEVRRRRILIQKDESLASNGSLVAEQALLVTTHEAPFPGWILLSEEEVGYVRSRPSTMYWERAAKEIPFSYVPTQFLSMDYLASLWDSILFSPHADDVKDAMRILDEDFEDIGFVKTSDDSSRYPYGRRNRSRSDRSAVVKLKNSANGIPLNSMGDGMLRVLQLALTIFPAKGGILLIDEFENGLHWAVQEKVWLMIFKLARDLDIQVFATTHSEDAVRAFSKVASAVPEEGIAIKLIRSKSSFRRDRTEAIVYTEDELKTATQTEIEIR